MRFTAAALNSDFVRRWNSEFGTQTAWTYTPHVILNFELYVIIHAGSRNSSINWRSLAFRHCSSCSICIMNSFPISLDRVSAALNLQSTQENEVQISCSRTLLPNRQIILDGERWREHHKVELTFHGHQILVVDQPTWSQSYFMRTPLAYYQSPKTSSWLPEVVFAWPESYLCSNATHPPPIIKIARWMRSSASPPPRHAIYHPEYIQIIAVTDRVSYDDPVCIKLYRNILQPIIGRIMRLTAAAVHFFLIDIRYATRRPAIFRPVGSKVSSANFFLFVPCRTLKDQSLFLLFCVFAANRLVTRQLLAFGLVFADNSIWRMT